MGRNLGTVAAWSAAGAATLLMTGLLAGCGSLSSLKQIGAGVRTPAGKTYTIGGRVTTVTVDTAGSVTATGTAGGGPVTVTEELSYTKTPPVTTRRVSGGTLTLAYTCKPELVCSVDYRIGVPRGVAVHAESREGSVTLTSVSGPVTAQAFAGPVTATGLSSPSAVLRSGAGGIDATFTAAPASVQASTDAGPITIAVPGSVTYKVSAHALVGVTTVTVRRSATAAHAITARSDLGSITISPS
jgi:hypothetical protein